MTVNVRVVEGASYKFEDVDAVTLHDDAATDGDPIRKWEMAPSDKPLQGVPVNIDPRKVRVMEIEVIDGELHVVALKV